MEREIERESNSRWLILYSAWSIISLKVLQFDLNNSLHQGLGKLIVYPIEYLLWVSCRIKSATLAMYISPFCTLSIVHEETKESYEEKWFAIMLRFKLSFKQKGTVKW